MKRVIVLALCTIFLTLTLSASPYAKFGSEPSLGVGARQSIGHHGVDLSLEMNPLHDQRHYHGKSLYLFYPQPEKRARLYFGGGVGLDMREQKFPNYRVWKHAKKERSWEGVVGCEFLQNRRMKLYTQVECSVPEKRAPEMRFSIGMGF